MELPLKSMKKHPKTKSQGDGGVRIENHVVRRKLSTAAQN